MRGLLDGVEHRRDRLVITRNGRPSGVIVPPEWYADAVAAMTGRGA